MRAGGSLKMVFRSVGILIGLLVGLLIACGASAVQAQSSPLALLSLPPGFQIEVYAARVPNARALALGSQGTVFVGTQRAGKVYAVVDHNQDYRVDAVHTLAEGLDMPSGVAFRDGALYVAEVNRILRFDDIESQLNHSSPPAALAPPVVVNDTLPRDRWHGWKFIRFGPDNLLYVPVGAPCNVCTKNDPRYASILRMKPDGTALENFARGVRNTSGLTGILKHTNSGLRRMVGTGWATTNRRVNSITPHSPACTSGSRTVMPAASPTRTLGQSGPAPNLRRRRRNSDHTSHRWACVFIRARCSRQPTGIRFSLPSTARGTAAILSAIG